MIKKVSQKFKKVWLGTLNFDSIIVIKIALNFTFYQKLCLYNLLNFNDIPADVYILTMLNYHSKV